MGPRRVLFCSSLALLASPRVSAFTSFGPSTSAAVTPTSRTGHGIKRRQPFALSALPIPGSFSEASNAHGDGATTSTTLSSSVEADDYLVLQSSGDIAYPSYLTGGSGSELVEEDVQYDLAESIVGNGISLEHPSLNFARFLIMVASAVYGTNFAVVKLVDEQMPFAVSAMLRFGLAATVATAVVLQSESKQQQPATAIETEERNAATFAGMEIGAWYCLGYLSQSIGLQTADASKSAFFNALAVIVVPLLDSFLRGKQMGVKEMSSVALAILGVGLLQIGPSLVAGTPVTFAHGDLFCLAQAAMFGVGYWRLEQVSSKHATQAGRITMGQLLGVAAGSTLFCGMTAEVPTIHELQGWMSDGFLAGGLVWTALVSTGMALYLETVALKAVSAAELTVLMTSVSLFGSAFAYVTMGETMSPIGMAGGLLILAGCVFSSLGGEKEAVVATMEDDNALQTTTTSSLFSETLDDSSSYPAPMLGFANATAAGVYQ